jgi:hypothetical protein
MGVLGPGAPAFADDVTQSTADVDQIAGNLVTIQQNGNRNAASVEQQAILGATHANAVSIQQYANDGFATVTQQGERNAAGIAQYANGDKAEVEQHGVNLGVQINQYTPNASISIKQFGTGTLNGQPITIKQF